VVEQSRKLHQDGWVISVVLFDLDDTLFAHRKAVNDGVLAHLRTLDVADPAARSSGASVSEADEVARWTALEEKHYTRYLAGELDYLGQRHARARDFMEPYGVTFPSNLAAETWFEEYLQHYRAAWTLYDDTLPCLDALAGVGLGVITNGVTHFQQPKLDVLGLTRYFTHIITSGDFGAVKPDPSIFLHACSVFDVAPASAMYVGDRFATDALGAAAAGLTGVWLDRSGAASDDQLAAAAEAGAHVIHSLADLLALVGR
jgi:putative hydrolase of the HAD superfamily